MLFVIGRNLLMPLAEHLAGRVHAMCTSAVKVSVAGLADARADCGADAEVAQSLPPFY